MKSFHRSTGSIHTVCIWQRATDREWGAREHSKWHSISKQVNSNRSRQCSAWNRKNFPAHKCLTKKIAVIIKWHRRIDTNRITFWLRGSQNCRFVPFGNTHYGGALILRCRILPKPNWTESPGVSALRGARVFVCGSVSIGPPSIGTLGVPYGVASCEDSITPYFDVLVALKQKEGS